MVCVIFYIDRASLGFHVNFVLCSIEIRNICGIIKKISNAFCLSELFVFDHQTL